MTYLITDKLLSHAQVSLTLALVMMIVGDMYWDQCQLSAASYLYYGGAFSLTINILNLTSALAKWWAVKVILAISLKIINMIF